MADKGSAPASRRPKRPPIKFNGAYCCSVNFLVLKLLEVVSLIVAVIFASHFNGPPSVVYIQIVGALGVATSIAWVLLFVINFNARFPDFFPVLMMVFHFILALLTIGVAICCGLLWPQFKGSIYPHYIISTVMSFVAAVLFLVDTLLNLLWWRGAVEEIITVPCSPWKYEVTI